MDYEWPEGTTPHRCERVGQVYWTVLIDGPFVSEAGAATGEVEDALRKRGIRFTNRQYLQRLMGEMATDNGPARFGELLVRDHCAADGRSHEKRIYEIRVHHRPDEAPVPPCPFLDVDADAYYDPDLASELVPDEAPADHDEDDDDVVEDIPQVLLASEPTPSTDLVVPDHAPLTASPVDKIVAAVSVLHEAVSDLTRNSAEDVGRALNAQLTELRILTGERDELKRRLGESEEINRHLQGQLNSLRRAYDELQRQVNGARTRVRV